MSRISKKLVLLAAVVGSVGTAMAFSLLGPYKSWQVTALGYNLPGDIGACMTPNEGYRWNVPVITYAYDESFIKYFGPKGMRAVDKAFAILNNLPPASGIRDDGSSIFIGRRRVPTDVTGQNLEAQAAQLLDVKSYALNMLIEQLGLAEPERYTFTLRGRNTETIGGVTYTNYSVVKYNFDPITLQPSSYVNGHLYSYQISDPILPQNYADAIEYVVDTLDPYSYTAVASSFPGTGQYFIGLSHDDVGAYRWLYSKNNMAVETLSPGVTGGTPFTGPGAGSPWIPYVGGAGSNIVIVSSPWLPFFGGTNAFLQGTNVIQGTNTFINRIVIAATNLTNFVVSQALRPGVDKMVFRKVAFDSLIGQTFNPITNKYVDNVITNRVLLLQPVERLINQPDILFVAEDLGLFNNLTPVVTQRTPTTAWQNNDAVNGQAASGGPGQIQAPGAGAGGTNALGGSVTIRFSDQLPYLLNETPAYLDEATALGGSGVWASFDGTTNPPVIFPAYGNLTLDDIIDQIIQAQ